MRAAWWSRAPAVLLRLVVFGGLWWTFVEGDGYGPVLAALAVLTATATSLFLSPPGPWRLRARALPGFALWFAWRSAAGGWDVARRALHPALPIAPGLVTWTTTLPAGAPRLMLAHVLGLLPGTLMVDAEGERFRLHALDTGTVSDAELAAAEARVGELFGIAGRNADAAVASVV